MPAARPPRKRLTLAQKADRYALYEQAVQCPEAEIDFVDEVFTRLRRRKAVTLREDFCGTARVCCEWVRRRARNRAYGVDVDGQVLEWARRHNLARLRPAARRRVRLVNADVRKVELPPVDLILALNFSYWVFKTRPGLRAYLRRVREGLVADGLLVLDAYGGYEAFRLLRERTPCRRFTYIWQQAAYSPVTGEGVCHIHFAFPDGSRLDKAFTYEWRLWTLPELRELLHEAGFRRATVYWEGWDEKKQDYTGVFAPADKGEPDAAWVAYLVAEK